MTIHPELIALWPRARSAVARIDVGHEGRADHANLRADVCPIGEVDRWPGFHHRGLRPLPPAGDHRDHGAAASSTMLQFSSRTLMKHKTAAATVGSHDAVIDGGHSSPPIAARGIVLSSAFQVSVTAISVTAISVTAISVTAMVSPHRGRAH